jgi:hypothetical protein
MAYHDGGKVAAALFDLETAAIRERLRATLRMLRKLTREPAVDADDARQLNIRPRSDVRPPRGRWRKECPRAWLEALNPADHARGVMFHEASLASLVQSVMAISS